VERAPDRPQDRDSLAARQHLPGRPLTDRPEVELVFDPFDLASIQVRWQGNPARQAIPHVIGRHSHPKARPEQPAPPPAPTGIDYIGLVDAAHDADLAGDAISFAGLSDPPPSPPGPDQLPGQTTIDEALAQEEEL
jgi:hypothetical protein